MYRILDIFEQTNARVKEDGVSYVDHRDVLKATEKTNPLANLQPYMLPTTGTILSLLLLRWYRQDWPRRIRSIFIGILCLALHHLGLSLLSLSLAIATTVWTYLPGSSKALDLPDHSQFMRNLQTIPPAEDGEHEECMVCWDNKHSIAELPCTHKTCTRCLGLMRQHYQTDCPLCHKPLFCINDRKTYALSKGSLAVAVANLCLMILWCVRNFKKGENLCATSGLCVIFGTCTQFWVVGMSIKQGGDDWWRGPQIKERWQLRWTLFNFVMNLFSLCTMMFNLWKYFDQDAWVDQKVAG